MEKKKKSVGKVIANVIFYLVALLVIVFSIFSIIAKQNFGVAKVFGYSPIVVLSDSMHGNQEDSFNKGDLIVIKSVKDTSTLAEGDIITFYDMSIIDNKKVPNSHRIIDVIETSNGLFFQTQGDNALTNPRPDQVLVKDSDVIGQYVFNIKGAGTILSKLQTPLGFFLVVVLPAVIFLIYEIFLFMRIIILEKMKKKPAIVDSKEAENAELKKQLEELKKTVEEKKD
ncbi:MAG: signal peptidase I [Bacteroidales bacterium]|nr:signal peptidase I [Bacteroidales bacterium]